MSASFINIFETKSNRVKGLSFHPSRPWVLAALHNGVVQMWDYRVKTLLDRYDEHDGPVRSVAFHPNQPLFVSGGDDYKIKVWNYKEKRCLFTLLGHLDYVRTVEFHPEQPWILSASDDHTIRIWNWQSRQCICVLTGHSHYVMCARFHHSDDLVVSASLDNTVRVWDISGLRKKGLLPSHESDSMKLQQDIFGSTDAIVKYVLEGHDRGVNWASFHPTLPLIVSGADDRQIKLWRMSDTKAWEVDTMRGHYNNVSCCIFHPRQDLMLSNGEDKTIRVWDMSKRTLLLTHRRENDRFWALTAHPERNLFAAGHDSGFVVFKLEKERPAMSPGDGGLFYVKERYIRHYDFGSQKDVPVMSIRKRDFLPRNIQYNKFERAVLVNYDGEGGSYELYQVPKGPATASGEGAAEGRRGSGRCAVWIARNRFAVLDKANAILIKDLQNQTSKPLSPPYSIDQLFTAPQGQLLIKADDRMILFDVAQGVEIAECPVPSGIKFVEWFQPASNDPTKAGAGSFVAMMSKDLVVIANHRLEIQCTLAERTRIKSGVWDDTGVFVYTTTSHIKYALPNGDAGIIRTLDQPIYLSGVRVGAGPEGASRIFCLDREIRNRSVTVDTTEYQFKQALTAKKYSDVLRMVKSSNLVGQAIIGYLQQKGFPEVALWFVKDERTRFELALESANIKIAEDSANRLDAPDVWKRLGDEALRQGHVSLLEDSLNHTKDQEKLSFFYAITGNHKKLKQQSQRAQKNKDLNGRYHNALLLGDVAERIAVLEEAGQLPLAYMTAKTHGLAEEAERLREKMNLKNQQQKKLQLQQQSADPDSVPDVPLEDLAPKVQGHPNAKCLLPPVPIMTEVGNWPQLTISRGPFDVGLHQYLSEQKRAVAGAASDVVASSAKTLAALGAAAAVEEDVGEEGWVEDEPAAEPAQVDTEASEEPNEWDVEMDIPKPAPKPKAAAAVQQVSLPRDGPSWPQLWCLNSDVPADHVAAGNFESAMQLLNAQIGACQFQSMKPHFMRLFSGARARAMLSPGTPAIDSYLLRNPDVLSQPQGLREAVPALALTVNELIEKLHAGYRATTAGKFQEAMEMFKYIFSALPLVCAQSSQELNDAKDLIQICTDYVVGLMTELKRKEVLASNKTQAGAIRVAELAAYFTHCNLQPVHLQLTLRSAMNIAIKLRNFATAYNMGRRLLDLNPKPDVAEKTQQALEVCEQGGLKDEAPLADYDERNPFVVCAHTFKPIYRGNPSVGCSYCAAQFVPGPEVSGKPCPVCAVGAIGVKGTGLVIVRRRQPARGAPQPSRSSTQRPAEEDDDF